MVGMFGGLRRAVLWHEIE